MAKVTAVTWTGENMEYEGTCSRCDEIFRTESDFTNPDKVKLYQSLKLYDDVDNIVAIRKNISKDEAQKVYDEILKEIKVGGAITEEYITELTGGYPDYTQRLVRAWVAYGITEKQGGMWVIQ